MEVSSMALPGHTWDPFGAEPYETVEDYSSGPATPSERATPPPSPKRKDHPHVVFWIVCIAVSLVAEPLVRLAPSFGARLSASVAFWILRQATWTLLKALLCAGLVALGLAAVWASFKVIKLLYHIMTYSAPDLTLSHECITPESFNHKLIVQDSTKALLLTQYPSLADLKDEASVLAFRPLQLVEDILASAFDGRTSALWDKDQCPALKDATTKPLAELLENPVVARCMQHAPPLNIVLIGTAHVSRKSAEDTKRVILAVKPSKVLVELCESRTPLLLRDKMDTGPPKSFIDSLKEVLASKDHDILPALMGALYAKLEGQLDISAGMEFVAARQAVEELNDQRRHGRSSTAGELGGEGLEGKVSEIEEADGGPVGSEGCASSCPQPVAAGAEAGGALHAAADGPALSAGSSNSSTGPKLHRSSSSSASSSSSSNLGVGDGAAEDGAEGLGAEVDAVGEGPGDVAPAHDGQGCMILLGDRPVGDTIKALWGSLSGTSRLKFIYQMLKEVVFLKADEDFMELMKQDDLLSAMLAELAEDFPELLRPLLHDRNWYLATQIWTSAQTSHEPMVAVVGKGHLQGVIYCLCYLSLVAARVALAQQEHQLRQRMAGDDRTVPFAPNVQAAGEQQEGAPVLFQ